MQDNVQTFKVQNLSITWLKTCNAFQVTIVGHISDENSELLKQVFDRIVNMHSDKVILNLQAISKISSSGIAKILVFEMRLSAQMRELVIEDIQNDVLATFKSFGLDKLLKIK